MKAFLIDFPEEMMRVAARIAKGLGLSRSAFIRKAVEKEVKAHAPDTEGEKDHAQHEAGVRPGEGQASVLCQPEQGNHKGYA